MKKAVDIIPKRYLSNNREIIQYFDKTPSDIICPHFYLLNWGHGCNFGCAYCYLRGTFYGNLNPVSYPISDILSSIKTFFLNKQKRPYVLNSGEKIDSLVFPELIKSISDEFEKQTEHKLLILTKSGNVNCFLDKPIRQTIFSFSINSPEISKRWEQNTPTPEMRIIAAKKLYDLNNEIRIRIDPIFPIDNWKKHYSNLIDNILNNLKPSRFTIGTPRGLSKTVRFAKERTWTKYFNENTSWGKKISFETRIDIYSYIIDELSEYDVSICKDTVDIWNQLGLDNKNIKCNCTL